MSAPQKYPPQQSGYPPQQQSGYPPQQQSGYPPQGNMYPPRQQPYPGGPQDPHAYPNDPTRPQPWAVQTQPYPGQSQIVMTSGAMMAAQMDPIEMASASKWRNCALFCSISSLICTWLLCFSIPAVVCACREVIYPGAKGGYKISVILSAVAWLITIGWIIFVAIYVVTVLRAVASSYSSALSYACSSYSGSYLTTYCAGIAGDPYWADTFNACCKKSG